MIGSTKISYFLLRLGLAFVFLWFGVDKFIHPNYWINAWVPSWFSNLLNRFHIETLSFIYINGIFEIAVGLGFIFNIFIRLFALLASLFLFAIIIQVGFNEVIIRDIGLLGATLALVFWNKKNF
jgi:uncharacterized membrane protein YkgB